MIVEFSKTAIADHILEVRGEHARRVDVKPLTESEMQSIGKQLLRVENKVQSDVADEFLQYYHDWLGGQTKMLTAMRPHNIRMLLHTHRHTTLTTYRQLPL